MSLDLLSWLMKEDSTQVFMNDVEREADLVLKSELTQDEIAELETIRLRIDAFKNGNIWAEINFILEQSEDWGFTRVDYSAKRLRDYFTGLQEIIINPT